MSPDDRKYSPRPAASSNIYTAILALAFCLVLATAVFVAYKCYFQYAVIFKSP